MSLRFARKRNIMRRHDQFGACGFLREKGCSGMDSVERTELSDRIVARPTATSSSGQRARSRRRSSVRKRSTRISALETPRLMRRHSRSESAWSRAMRISTDTSTYAVTCDCGVLRATSQLHLSPLPASAVLAPAPGWKTAYPAPASGCAAKAIRARERSVPPARLAIQHADRLATANGFEVFAQARFGVRRCGLAS